MELKIHVDNKIRIVSGITDETTVHDIIIALAYSLKQTGRFYLFEKFVYLNQHRKKCKVKRLPRIMAPNEKPIQVLNNYLNYLDQDEYIEFHLIKSNIDPALPNMNNLNNSTSINKNVNNDSSVDSLVNKSNCKRGEMLMLMGNKLERGGNFNTNELMSASMSSCYENVNSFDDLDVNSYKLIKYKDINDNERNSAEEEGDEEDNDEDIVEENDNTELENEYDNNDDDEDSILNDANGLLNEINRQQSLLQLQSKKMNKLLKRIEKYELAKMKSSQTSPTGKESYLMNNKKNLKLSNLELINNLNLKTLRELERDTNESILNKEIELNQYLLAQQDYYKRKLNDLNANLNNKFEFISQLENEYDKLKNKLSYNSCHNLASTTTSSSISSSSSNSSSATFNLPIKTTVTNHDDTTSSDADENLSSHNQANFTNRKLKKRKRSLMEELEKSVKNFELNKAKIDYLDTKWNSLENSLQNKRCLIEMLEIELNNLTSNNKNSYNSIQFNKDQTNNINKNNVDSYLINKPINNNFSLLSSDSSLFLNFKKQLNHNLNDSRLDMINKNDINNNRMNINREQISHLDLENFDYIHYF